MSYSNYSFCVFDDWITIIQNKTAKPNKSEINKANKRIWRFTTKLSNSLFLVWREWVNLSCYDDSFDEEQFALYNYDATYQNVRSLFNKYRMFKNKVSEEYGKLGNTSRQLEEKVDNPSHKNNSTARHAEQLIQLKDFIEYCDVIICKNIKDLNYYEKWIFDEVLIRGKRLSSIADDKKCDRSYVYLSKKKKSCVLKVSMWFDIYVINDNLMKELKSYKDYNDL